MRSIAIIMRMSTTKYFVVLVFRQLCVCEHACVRVRVCVVSMGNSSLYSLTHCSTHESAADDDGHFIHSVVLH